MPEPMRSQQQTPLHIGLSLAPTWWRGQAWRAPDSRIEELFELEPRIELARAAEAAGIDFLFLPDVPALDVARLNQGPAFGALDPLVLSSALATATSRIGLVTTAATAFHPPYLAARQLLSLHRLSRGRAGWNVVTALRGHENFGVVDTPSAERYAQALEHLEVVRALWRSFPPEALLLDRATGRFADEQLVRPIEHEGAWFRVAGPLTLPAPAGGPPPIFQAGDSESGRDFAARVADAVFAATASREAAAQLRADLRARAEQFGRDATAVRLLPGASLFLAATSEEAAQLHRHETGPGARHWTITGTVQDAVREIAEWASCGAIDGFIALPGGGADSLRRITEELVPALTEAGLFRGAYEGTTLREHLRIAAGAEPSRAAVLRAVAPGFPQQQPATEDERMTADTTTSEQPSSTQQTADAAQQPWQPVDIPGFASLFRAQPGGVAVITAEGEHGPVALTATSVASVSVDPALLVFSASDGSSAAPTIVNAETLIVHFLDSSDLEIGKLAATSGIDRFADTSLWSRLPSGEPTYHTVGRRARVRTIERVKAGTATVIIAEGLEVSNAAGDDTPALVYHNRTWHTVGGDFQI